MNGTNPSGSKRATGPLGRDPDLNSPLTDSFFRTRLFRNICKCKLL